MNKILSKKSASQISASHHDIMSDHFKKNYNFYDKDIFYNAFTYGRSKIDIELVKQLSTLPKNSKILDLGCGTGDQLKILDKYNFDCYGLDPAPSIVEIAKKKLKSEDKIKLGTAQKIPFKDNYFDFVLMIEVLRYFDLGDINKAIKETHRVLKPGGKIFSTFVNKWSLDFFYIFQNVRRLIKKSSFDNINPYCQFFDPKKVKNIYKKNDFTEIDIIGNMFSPLRISYKINRQLGKHLAMKLDKFGDFISNKKFFIPFSGHLIGIGKKP